MSSSPRLFSVLVVVLFLTSGCASVQRRADDSSRSWSTEDRFDKATDARRAESQGNKSLCFGCPKQGSSSEVPSTSTDSPVLALDTALRAHPGLTACVGAAAADGVDLEPPPTLELSLTPEGQVTEAGLLGSVWSATPLDQCVAGSLDGVDLGVSFSGRTKDVRVRWRVTSPTH